MGSRSVSATALAVPTVDPPPTAIRLSAPEERASSVAARATSTGTWGRTSVKVATPSTPSTSRSACSASPLPATSIGRSAPMRLSSSPTRTAAPAPVTTRWARDSKTDTLTVGQVPHSWEEDAAGSDRPVHDSRPGGLHVVQAALLEVEPDPARCGVLEPRRQRIPPLLGAVRVVRVAEHRSRLAAQRGRGELRLVARRTTEVHQPPADRQLP